MLVTSKGFFWSSCIKFYVIKMTTMNFDWPKVIYPVYPSHVKYLTLTPIQLVVEITQCS